MTRLGIFIDLKSAHIVTAAELEHQLHITILSGVEPHHNAEGEGEHLTIVSHHRQANKREGQKNHFFEDILKHIPHGLESFFIFGPAKIKDQFKNYIEDRHSEFFKKLDGVETASAMSEAKMKEKVRKYYNID